MEAEILYRDKDVVVCIKPIGVSGENTEKCDGLPDILSAQLGAKEVYTLHRLDTGVGGLMAYALSKKGASVLSRDIAEGNFHKYYTATVYGRPENDEGVFEDLLFKDSKKNKSFVVTRERKGVKKAKLSYRVLESKKDGEKILHFQTKSIDNTRFLCYTDKKIEVHRSNSNIGAKPARALPI